MAPLEKVPGSFRDPASRVFLDEGRILRGVDEATFQALRDLADRGVLAQLTAEGLLIETEFLDAGQVPPQLAAEHGFRHFLRHRTVPVLSWPYEWTLSMLADAGLATLALQRRLLAAGYSLKDASAYNVQFVAGRPVFIDLGSIERPRRLDVWFALGQFSQMFTFPLLLCRRAGWDLRAYFLAHLEGLDVRRVARVFGRRGWLSPGLFWDVTLPALLTHWAEGGGQPVAGSGQQTAEKLALPPSPPRPLAPSPPLPAPPSAQRITLTRLERKIARLAAGYRPSGGWAEYQRTCTYADSAQAAKRGLVERFLRQTQPARVLDLGCNTGEYSRLAADCGAEVIAADADHDAVELLYRELRQKPARILPMVVDLCNPSPGVGVMNRERQPWSDRVRADCVLALALLHHLLVVGNLPLAAVCELLDDLTVRDLVLEFIPPDDAMFRRLLRYRVDYFADLTLDACREAFSRRFRLIAEEPIPGTGRTLLFWRKAEGGRRKAEG